MFFNCTIYFHTKILSYAKNYNKYACVVWCQLGANNCLSFQVTQENYKQHNKINKFNPCLEGLFKLKTNKHHNKTRICHHPHVDRPKQYEKTKRYMATNISFSNFHQNHMDTISIFVMWSRQLSILQYFSFLGLGTRRSL